MDPKADYIKKALESEFIENLSLEDMREAVKGRTDFRECVYDDHTIFVYFLGMAKDIFPDPQKAPDPFTAYLWKLRRECRGTVFSTVTGKVISRRFHKFFNVNETEETNVKNIKLDGPFVILEKMDGSMIAPYFTGGKLRFATKNGVTDTGLAVEAYIDTCAIPYREFSEEWISKDYTPIYEWCSSTNPIVLQYQKDALTLIALRNMTTGKYLSYNDTVENAKSKGIPVVKSWSQQEAGTSNENQSFEDFYKTIRKNKGIEGFVIRLNSGLMYKIKTEWYFDINHALDAFKNPSNERNRWSYILGEKYDDLRPFLSDDERDSTDRFMEDLLKEIEKSSDRLLKEVANAKANKTRQQFSEYVNSAGRGEKGIIWKIYAELEDTTKRDEKSQELDHLLPTIVEVVTKHILSCLSSKQSFEAIRHLAGNISFDNYKKKTSFVRINKDE